MKHFLVLALLLPAPAIAAATDHDQCKDAKDYAGCMQVQTHGVAAAPSNELKRLRSAMLQVSSRLAAGTSLRDSTITFQPVIDAHAVVPLDQQDSLAYQAASMAIETFDAAQTLWSARIQYASYGRYTGTYHTGTACKYFQKAVQAAARNTGNPKAFSWSWQKAGLLGVCRFSTGPETPLYVFTAKVLREGATDPERIKTYTAKRNEAVRLAALGPWERHLEKNPGLRQWAKAYPAMASAKQQQYIAKHGSDPVAMPPLPSFLSTLRGTRVEAHLGGSTLSD